MLQAQPYKFVLIEQLLLKKSQAFVNRCVEHFGTFCILVMLWGNKQTNGLKHHTHA